MKAIIMAGGDGSRLRPITCTVPKPMVRILDVPVMEYAIELLRRHGIRDIAVTLRYLPDSIRDYFGDGSRFGVSIRYFTETGAALGTAGSVKQAQDFLDETFVVLSGDGITDCNLTSAIEYHTQSQAQATIVTVRTNDPREYGLVCTDADGFITHFREKPDWSDVVCDRINTGIYIMEPSLLRLIPPGISFDFSRDLFPAMLENHLPLSAYHAQCYWCDIGDAEALLRAGTDALHGRISLIPMPADGIFHHPTARIDPAAIIEPPVYIGENVHIHAHAVVGPDSIIGAGTCISSGASVRRSVTAEYVHIGEHAQLRGCRICHRAHILPYAQVYENAVVGDGCVIGRSAEIAAGVRIWPQKTLADHARLQENLILGHTSQAIFHAGAINCRTPGESAACAQALCAAVKPLIVLIAHSRSAVAEAQHLAACAGLMAQGAQVYDCRCCTQMELRSAIDHIGADCACYLTGTHFFPLDRHGVSLTGDARRRFLSALNRGDCPLPYSDITRLPQSAGRCDLIYLKSIVIDEIIRSLSGFPRPVAVYAEHEQLLSLAERAFLRAGLNVRAEWEEEMMELSADEIGIWLSESGESMRLFTSAGEMTEAEMQLLTAQTLLDMGETVLILPEDCSPAVEDMARKHGAQTIRSAGSPAQWARDTVSRSPKQLALHTDGILLALHILSMLHSRRTSPEEFRSSIPASVRHRRTIELPYAVRAHALERLNARLRPPQPGRFHMTQGASHAWILPDEDGCCTVLSESADTETARELCDFYEKIVRESIQP